MIAALVAAFSALAWLLAACALFGAGLGALGLLFRANRALSEKFFAALCFIPLFLWELLKRPRDFFRMVFNLAALPFALVLGFFLGLFAPLKNLFARFRKDRETPLPAKEPLKERRPPHKGRAKARSRSSSAKSA